MRPVAQLLCVAVIAVLATACDKGTPEDAYSRGRGKKAANVTTAAEAQIVEAAMRAAFDVEPGLYMRMHTRKLPRTAGDSGGAPVSPALVQALRDGGLVLGTCEPARAAAKGTPRCSGPEAGYIIRTSDVIAMTPDTLEVYFSAEAFGPATGKNPESLRFEKVYLLVKEGARYRVAREGRVRQ